MDGFEILHEYNFCCDGNTIFKKAKLNIPKILNRALPALGKKGAGDRH
jgi:hypothetical protein